VSGATKPFVATFADCLYHCEFEHTNVLCDKKFGGDVYTLLRDMEYLSVDGGEISALPIDLHQMISVGKLADQLDFHLRQLRGSR